MYQVEMSAAVRETTGKGAMRRLRQEGLTPAVVYGAGKEALALQMETKTLQAQLLEFSKVNTVVSLNVEGHEVKSVLIQDIQSNPLTEIVIHADFCEIDMDKAREFSVPLVFEGTPKGVDLGGSAEVYANSVILKAKPLDIPNEVKIDITALEIGDAFTVADLALEGDIELVTPAAKTLISVEK